MCPTFSRAIRDPSPKILPSRTAGALAGAVVLPLELTPVTETELYIKTNVIYVKTYFIINNIGKKLSINIHSN